MRQTIIILSLMFAFIQAQGQLQIGVKGFVATNYGAETTEQFLNPEPLQLHTIAVRQAEIKRGIGLSLYRETGKSFLMADVAFARGGRNFALQSVNISQTPLDPAVNYRTEENDLRFTITAGVTYKNFKFGAGPEFSRVVSETENLSEIQPVEYVAQNLRSGFNFLIGYKIKNHIHLDLKHTYMFQNTGQGYQYLGIPFELDSNTKYLELSLGVFL